MEIEEITPRISNGVVQPDENSNGAENDCESKSSCNPDFVQFVSKCNRVGLIVIVMYFMLPTQNDGLVGRHICILHFYFAQML